MPWRRVSTYENGLLLMIAVTIGVLTMDRISFNVLSPFIVAELGLSNFSLGVLSAVMSMSFAVSGYLVGVFSDTSGKQKPLLIAAVLVFSLATALCGLAGSLIMLAAARILLGLSAGPVIPLAQSIVSAESSATRRAFNMGFVQAFAGSLLGSMVGPVAVTQLAHHFGWRTALLYAGLPGLIIGLLLLRFLRRRAGSAPAPTSLRSRFDLGRALTLLRVHNIWLCVLIATLFAMWMITLLTFLPLFLTRLAGFTPTQMGFVLSVKGIGACAGALIIPVLADRLGRKPVLVASAFGAALTPLAALLLNDSTVLMVSVMAIGYLASGCSPLVLAVIPFESVRPSEIGTAFGLVMGIGEIFGAVIPAPLAGRAADLWSLAAPLWIATGAVLLAGCIALLIHETAPRKLRSALPLVPAGN